MNFRLLFRNVSLFTILFFSLIMFPAASAFAQQPLKLGIHPYLSSTEIMRRFSPLAEYLSKELKRPVTIDIAGTYSDHIQRVGKNAVDIAFMGPASYVIMTTQYGRKPLLAGFETKGKKTFRGVIAAKKGGPITSLSQLKGKTFAFGDIESTMSHFVPRFMLLKKGVDVKDLSSHQFLANHDNIALGVLMGSFDAGALKEDVYNQYQSEGLTAIAFSPEINDHVFVAGAQLSRETIRSFRKALLSLKDRPEGKLVLSSIKQDLSALVSVHDSEYDSLRKVLDELRTIGVEP